MRYMIAIDGGGTKTRTVLFREDGQVLYEQLSPGSNPLDVGVEESQTRLLRAMHSAAAQCPGPLSGVYGGVAGLVYFEDFFQRDLREELHCAHFCVETDGRNLISSELYHQEDGCCLIVGTGCGTWIRKKSVDHIFHVGGWGYLVDTLGSGYSLGREAVRAVCLATDGRGADTVLCRLLEEETGLPLLACVPWLYEGGRARFASLAHLVFEGKERGDRVCHEILEEGAARLADLIWAADPYFETDYSVVMGGGIVTNFPEYAALIRSKCPPRANMLLAEAPPIYGAAVEAMRLCGVPLPPDFRQRFLSGLGQ